jgi:hypothetical protein
MKLAAGGELGIGVGEEEWGSGEREVLEDFAKRTDGLVDLVVCRFGDAAKPSGASGKSSKSGSKKEDISPDPWIGIGGLQQGSDGIVFSGTGVVSRQSMKDISEWARWVYAYGESAYGVRDSPSSDRRRRKRKAHSARQSRSETKNNMPDTQADTQLSPTPGIPRSILATADKSLAAATNKADLRTQTSPSRAGKPKSKSPIRETDSWTKYLTLGYGTAWGIPGFDLSEQPNDGLKSQEEVLKSRLEAHIAQENAGYFLIGMKGDPEDESDEFEDESESTSGWNKRLMIRTLHVTMNNTSSLSLPTSTLLSQPTPGSDHKASIISMTSPSKRRTRLRVVLYAHRPFIYVLLFAPSTASLNLPPFYRHLHTFLSPLNTLLLRRTGANIARTRLASQPGLLPPGIVGTEGVWAAVHDVDDGCTWSSLPAIPSVVIDGDAEEWSRTDALNVHFAAVEILTGAGEEERERSAKTGKGWWIVWARRRRAEGKPETDEDEENVTASNTVSSRPLTTTLEEGYFGPNEGTWPLGSRIPGDREILIVRRAKDADTRKSRVVSGWSLGGGDNKASLDSSRLGIGFDPRKYMEGIVRLGR